LISNLERVVRPPLSANQDETNNSDQNDHDDGNNNNDDDNDPDIRVSGSGSKSKFRIMVDIVVKVVENNPNVGRVDCSGILGESSGELEGDINGIVETNTSVGGAVNAEVGVQKVGSMRSVRGKVFHWGSSAGLDYEGEDEGELGGGAAPFVTINRDVEFSSGKSVVGVSDNAQRYASVEGNGIEIIIFQARDASISPVDGGNVGTRLGAYGPTIRVVKFRV